VTPAEARYDLMRLQELLASLPLLLQVAEVSGVDAMAVAAEGPALGRRLLAARMAQHQPAAPASAGRVACSATS
jgi:hypothetical protein